jgi:hypothetical protein
MGFHDFIYSELYCSGTAVVVTVHTHYVYHDIIKTDEWSDKIMNMFFVHDMISTNDIG